MKFPLKAFLIAALVVALLLMGMLAYSVHLDQKLFRLKQVELENSRAIWENIAAETEALQEELKEAQNALK